MENIITALTYANTRCVRWGELWFGGYPLVRCRICGIVESPLCDFLAVFVPQEQLEGEAVAGTIQSECSDHCRYSHWTTDALTGSRIYLRGYHPISSEVRWRGRKILLGLLVTLRFVYFFFRYLLVNWMQDCILAQSRIGRLLVWLRDRWKVGEELLEPLVNLGKRIEDFQKPSGRLPEDRLRKLEIAIKSRQLGERMKSKYIEEKRKA